MRAFRATHCPSEIEVDKKLLCEKKLYSLQQNKGINNQRRARSPWG